MRMTHVAGKIGAGFALVIFIAAASGAIELWNMGGVQGDAGRLDRETVPQVAVANNVERSLLQAMYSFRGFLLTMDSDSLDQAKQHLGDAQKALQDAQTLAAKYPRLVVLKKSAADALSKLDDYNTLVEDAANANSSIVTARMDLSAAGSTLLNGLSNYVVKKITDLRRVSSGGQRSILQEISIANEMRSAGNTVSTASLQTQATDDPSFLKDAMQTFAGFPSKFDAWRALPTVGADDRLQLDGFAKAADAYQQACQTVLDGVTKIAQVNTSQVATAQAVLDTAQQISDEGLKDAGVITKLTVTRMATAIIMLVAGIVAAAVMGIIIAIAITRTITRPLTKGVEFAQQIARGDFTRSLEIRQHDEVGTLADALNEMAVRLSGVVTTVQESASQVAHSSSRDLRKRHAACRRSAEPGLHARRDERLGGAAGGLGGRGVGAREIPGGSPAEGLQLHGAGAGGNPVRLPELRADLRARPQVLGERGGRRPRGPVRGGQHHPHRGRVGEDRRHRGRDFRHCGPDEPPRPERLH